MALREPTIYGIETEAEVLSPGLHMIHDRGSEAWAAAAEIEASVFTESGYVDTAEELSEEYRKYESVSGFAVVVDESGEVTGSMRVIAHEEGIGIKTFDDITKGRLELNEDGKDILELIDPSGILEVGTIAVRTDMRGRPEDEGKASVQLYGALVAECERQDRRYAVASFDADYFERFSQIFGPSCIKLGPAVDYMGSMTVPAILDMPALYEYIGEQLPPVQEAIAKAADSMR